MTITHPTATAAGEAAPTAEIPADLRSQGVSHPVPWTTTETARELAGRVLADHAAARREIIRNPHLDIGWFRDAAASLLDAVQAVIGPAVAIENTFLVIKWPGTAFEVPWHQDGIDRRIELDPGRSVAAWLALTDATPANGCLHIAPGSHRLGYLPYELEDDHGAARGRAGRSAGFTGEHEAVAIPVAAGDAVLMDVRLLHRSGSNTTDQARVGLNVRYVAPGGLRMRDHTTPSLTPLTGTGW
ncbi:phytanoyl-CoA dioxygenase family protein [Thermomonospora cellulosilytica]|uniref:Ectoine hydroxylase-related dioxygenase (Phytanoyl-CoA dioxygenase family) n=1 Tax=Thermomonospora cellulosilytica TaxID=1411118 RepID=A0A7W3N1T6_9ACTN|nr:phytanoyl-CoA dioxygenase family protein [Thermomonospora cellulosilytica]MBA9005937.1 ectoine hydroxylase-related dioxygenase (phytanoyl-CoA dioxygenase family) [Thermomonospora cellulosilytica]